MSYDTTLNISHGTIFVLHGVDTMLYVSSAHSAALNIRKVKHKLNLI